MLYYGAMRNLLTLLTLNEALFHYFTAITDALHLSKMVENTKVI